MNCLWCSWPAVGSRLRSSGGINTQSFIWLCSHLEPFTNGRRAQKLLFNFWDYNTDLASLLFIILTAAVTICGGHLHCQCFLLWVLSSMRLHLDSNTLNEIYNKGLAGKHFNAEFLHVISLTHRFWYPKVLISLISSLSIRLFFPSLGWREIKQELSLIAL